MSEVMTMEELKSRFPSEHVLLEDPETNEYGQVVAGRVLWHNKDLQEVYRKGIELRPKHSAFVYTGTYPENTAFAL